MNNSRNKIVVSSTLITIILSLSILSTSELIAGSEPGHASKSYANALIWDSSDKHIIALRNNEIVIHDAFDLRPINTIKESNSMDSTYPSLDSITLSSDGNLLATTGFEKGIWIWSINGFIKKRQLENSSDAISITFNEDGKQILASGFNATAGIWNTETGKLLTEIANKPSNILSIAVSPDNKVIATGYTDGKLRLQKLPGLTELALFEGMHAPVTGVAFSPDGTLLAANSSGHELLIIDMKNYKKKYSLISPSILNEKKGKLAEGLISMLTIISSARTMQLSGAPGNIYLPNNQNSNSLELRCSVGFSADGKMLGFMRSSYKWPGRYKLEIYEASTGKLITKIKGIRPVMSFSSSTNKVVVSTVEGLVVLDVSTGKELARYAQ